MENKFVVGFAFTEDKQQILLMNKLNPEWQKGYLNGIGGKIDKNDLSQSDAMNRETKEETVWFSLGNAEELCTVLTMIMRNLCVMCFTPTLILYGTIKNLRMNDLLYYRGIKYLNTST